MAGEAIPFCRPAVGDAEIAAVTEVLRSGWITTGPKVSELEASFARLVGSRHCISVVSGTAGMHLTLLALNIGPGDEVVTPSMTWVSTVNLIELLGATPVFVDIDRDTLMTSVEQIATVITPRTKAIVPVHFAGASLDLAPIYALGKKHHIPIVEDAAHAVGTLYRGRQVGAGGLAIFSFQAIKNVTCAEGGAICTDDDELAARLRRLRFHGLGADAYDRETQGRAPQAEVLEPGLKYNLPDINAAIALVQLARLAELNARRRAIAQRYVSELDAIEGLVPLGEPSYQSTHAWHLFVVRVDPERGGVDRDTFMQELKAQGIGTGLHFRAVHSQKYYRQRYRTIHLPATEWNSERICSLPLFPDLTDQQQTRVIDTIKKVMEKRN